jgi:hypothetical protein
MITQDLAAYVPEYAANNPELPHAQQIALPGANFPASAQNRYWMVLELGGILYGLSLGDNGSVWRVHCNDAGLEVLGAFDALQQALVNLHAVGPGHAVPVAVAVVNEPLTPPT